MPSILDSLSGAIGDDVLGQIGRQLGTDPATPSRAVSVALPMLVSALAHRSAQEGGADALAGARAGHDGVPDNLSGVIGSGGNADLLGVDDVMRIAGGLFRGSK